MEPPRIILDTNVFVAAGFNPESDSRRLVEQVREGRLRMVWHEETRCETEHIVRKIPPLSWERMAELFREADRYDGALVTESFEHVPDEADRKFAALAAATGAVLVTMDKHLLDTQAEGEVSIVTPGTFHVASRHVASRGRPPYETDAGRSRP